LAIFFLTGKGTTGSSNETKGLSDKDKPLDPINNLHSFVKRCKRAHGRYDHDNLQDWMNLIRFVGSEPRNRYEMVALFYKTGHSFATCGEI